MSEARTDRHDPTGGDDYISIQHVERYRFACQRLKPGSRVLDVACGTGYGTAMLRDHGCDVVAGDLDPVEIASVRQSLGYDRIVCLDVRHIPFVDGSFDAVVSFETIEHIVEGRQFLEEIRRVLRPGGVFIGSTPNISYTAHPWYHVKEYEPEEYYSLVRDIFGNIECRGQYFRWRDRLLDIVNRSAAIRYRIFRLPFVLVMSSAKRLAASWQRMPAAAKSAEGESAPVGDYAVTDFIRKRLLRIMVSVSCK